MATTGPWFQPPDIVAPLQPLYKTLGANITSDWQVDQAFGGPSPYFEPDANECAWQLARSNGFVQPGLHASAWNNDPSDRSNYVPPPTCPVLPSGSTTSALASTAPALVGTQYQSFRPISVNLTDLRWTVWYGVWLISLSEAALAWGKTLTDPVPDNVVLVEWEDDTGQLLGVDVAGTRLSGGPDSAAVQLRAGVNSDALRTWGPSGDGTFAAGPSTWASGDPDPSPWQVLSTGDTAGDIPTAAVPDDVLAAGLAWEADHGYAPFTDFRSRGLQILAYPAEADGVAPAFPGAPPDGLTLRWEGYGAYATYDLTGTVRVRPSRARYVYDTIPPLRWRSRDDGLGLTGAGRARSGSSVQTTLRHRGGYR